MLLQDIISWLSTAPILARLLFSQLEQESKLGSSAQNEEDINDKVATNTPSQLPRSTGQQDADVSWVDRLGVWPRRVLWD